MEFLNLQSFSEDKYPNIVMIVLSIMENRLSEQNSNFAKMLKGLRTLNVVDAQKSNVVVVLTHASSIARKAQIWQEKVDKKKLEGQALIKIHLGVSPEVIIQENKPQENDLKQEGDWHIYPISKNIQRSFIWRTQSSSNYHMIT